MTIFHIPAEEAELTNIRSQGLGEVGRAKPLRGKAHWG